MVVEVLTLDTIIKETIIRIESSQKQIYDIAEHTQGEYNHIKDELDNVKKTVTQLIVTVDKLIIKEKKARHHLMEVDRDFNRFSEDDIKKAYEQAQKLQLELVNLRGEEQLLRYKRDELERSLRRLKEMLDKAESMTSHLGVAANYLNNNLSNISSQLAEVQHRQQIGLSIMIAQEEERKRLAREIHDGPAQVLANVVMRSEYISKLLQINPKNVPKELVNLQESVSQSLDDVRKIIFDLRPMVLDDLGLVPAIKRHINNYKKQYNIDASFVFFGKQKRLITTTEVALFRVIQEALTNVQKHAEAKKVLVKMEQLNNKITILIKDDGRGFNYRSMKQCKDKDREHYGLINMRERVQILNGKFKINSTPGKGTVITFSISN